MLFSTDYGILKAAGLLCGIPPEKRKGRDYPMLFLHEFERIEAEAFLTLAAELIEEDGVVTAEEDALLDEYAAALGVTGFTFDAAASAAARFTMSQLNETSKRKVYMELYAFAVCDGCEAPEERRSLNELRDALELDPHICKRLEECAEDLFSVYDEIEETLSAEPSAVIVKNELPIPPTAAAPEA